MDQVVDETQEMQCSIYGKLMLRNIVQCSLPFDKCPTTDIRNHLHIIELDDHKSTCVNVLLCDI